MPKRKEKIKIISDYVFYSPQWFSYCRLNFENLWQKQSTSSQNGEN